MDHDLILLPLIAQVLLTLALYALLSARKSQASARGDVDEARRGLFDDAWPESVIQVNNCIRNQFELPVLFYVLCGALWALDAVGPVSTAAAWLFVGSRIVHAVIHTGANNVPTRRRVFTASYLLIAAMTGMVAVSIF